MDKNRNTGDYNTGYRNTGYYNTGDYNTGYRNTGDYNTGNWNTGDRNTGDCNTGYYNTGYRNTGYRNTGDYNTGNWNTGNWNTGYCNTVTPGTTLIFNKLAKLEEWDNAIKPNWIFFALNLDLPKWVAFAELTSEDKKKYKDSEALGGYLLGGIRKQLSDEEKIALYKESAKKSWDNTNHEDRMLTYQLPNFDANVAQEIFGIDFNAYINKKDDCIVAKDDEYIIVNGIKYKKV